MQAPDGALYELYTPRHYTSTDTLVHVDAEARLRLHEGAVANGNQSEEQLDAYSPQDLIGSPPEHPAFLGRGPGAVARSR